MCRKEVPESKDERFSFKTRKEFDEFYDNGDCPKPSNVPRKWQYLPVTKTGPIHDLVLQLLWLPLGTLLFGVVLVLNLFYFAWTILVKGGIRQNALRSTQPRGNILIRFLLGLLDIFNVTEIPKSWDAKKAFEAFEKFTARNGFRPNQVRFEVHEIPDTVSRREVVHKYHKAECHPVTLHRVWVLIAPSRTYICTASNFCEFDGTSCFNLVKGYVETYYEGIAPLVRPQTNSSELDLTLTDDPKVLKHLNWKNALLVCFVAAYKFGWGYGRYLFSRELFDLACCASPEVCVAIETIDELETNKKLVMNLKKTGQKMFSHIMCTSAKAFDQCSPRVENPILLTQVSCQSRFYEPKIRERNVCGNWLIGLGGTPTLGDLKNTEWCNKFYQKLRNELESFSGSVAFGFIAQTMLGFNATALWANPRLVYWFNNYGTRSMHPDAGGVRYVVI